MVLADCLIYNGISTWLALELVQNQSMFIGRNLVENTIRDLAIFNHNLTSTEWISS